MSKNTTIIGLFLLSGLMLASCAQYPLKDADLFLDEGSYGRAVLRYRDYISEHPNGPFAEDATYKIGLAYLKSEHTLGAQQEMRKYLMYYPNGKYAEEARAIMAEMQRTKVRTALAGQAARQKIREEIDYLEKALKDGTFDDVAKGHYLLGGKYWEVGQYDKSFEHDKEAYRLNGDYAFDGLFRQRVGFAADGTMYSLAPDYQGQRQEIIRVVNDRKQVNIVEGPHRGDRSYTVYVVTGEVLNRGTVKVRNVQLDVALLRLGNEIVASRTVRIGDLMPGMKRPFSVDFGEFETDDAYSIFDYRITPVYEDPTLGE